MTISSAIVSGDSTITNTTVSKHHSQLKQLVKRQCMCDLADACRGMSAAFVALKDPRGLFVALENSQSHREACQQLLCRKAQPAETSTERKQFVAVHHFHPDIVEGYMDTSSSIRIEPDLIPFPSKLLSKSDVEHLELPIPELHSNSADDKERNDYDKYLILPNYDFSKAHADLKERMQKHLRKLQLRDQVKRQQRDQRRRELRQILERSKQRLTHSHHNQAKRDIRGSTAPQKPMSVIQANPQTKVLVSPLKMESPSHQQQRKQEQVHLALQSDIIPQHLHTPKPDDTLQNYHISNIPAATTSQASTLASTPEVQASPSFATAELGEITVEESSSTRSNSGEDSFPELLEKKHQLKDENDTSATPSKAAITSVQCSTSPAVEILASPPTANESLSPARSPSRAAGTGNLLHPAQDDSQEEDAEELLLPTGVHNIQKAEYQTSYSITSHQPSSQHREIFSTPSRSHPLTQEQFSTPLQSELTPRPDKFSTPQSIESQAQHQQQRQRPAKEEQHQLQQQPSVEDLFTTPSRSLPSQQPQENFGTPLPPTKQEEASSGRLQEQEISVEIVSVPPHVDSYLEQELSVFNLEERQEKDDEGIEHDNHEQKQDDGDAFTKNEEEEVAAQTPQLPVRPELPDTIINRELIQISNDSEIMNSPPNICISAEKDVAGSDARGKEKKPCEGVDDDRQALGGERDFGKAGEGNKEPFQTLAQTGTKLSPTFSSSLQERNDIRKRASDKTTTAAAAGASAPPVQFNKPPPSKQKAVASPYNKAKNIVIFYACLMAMAAGNIHYGRVLEATRKHEASLFDSSVDSLDESDVPVESKQPEQNELGTVDDESLTDTVLKDLTTAKDDAPSSTSWWSWKETGKQESIGNIDLDNFQNQDTLDEDTKEKSACASTSEAKGEEAMSSSFWFWRSRKPELVESVDVETEAEKEVEPGTEAPFSRFGSDSALADVSGEHTVEAATIEIEQDVGARNQLEELTLMPTSSWIVSQVWGGTPAQKDLVESYATEDLEAGEVAGGETEKSQDKGSESKVIYEEDRKSPMVLAKEEGVEELETPTKAPIWSWVSWEKYAKPSEARSAGELSESNSMIGGEQDLDELVATGVRGSIDGSQEKPDLTAPTQRSWLPGFSISRKTAKRAVEIAGSDGRETEILEDNENEIADDDDASEFGMDESFRTAYEESKPASSLETEKQGSLSDTVKSFLGASDNALDTNMDGLTKIQLSPEGISIDENGDNGIKSAVRGSVQSSESSKPSGDHFSDVKVPSRPPILQRMFYSLSPVVEELPAESGAREDVTHDIIVNPENADIAGKTPFVRWNDGDNMDIAPPEDVSPGSGDKEPDEDIFDKETEGGIPLKALLDTSDGLMRAVETGQGTGESMGGGSNELIPPSKDEGSATGGNWSLMSWVNSVRIYITSSVGISADKASLEEEYLGMDKNSDQNEHTDPIDFDQLEDGTDKELDSALDEMIGEGGSSSLVDKELTLLEKGSFHEESWDEVELFVEESTSHEESVEEEESFVKEAISLSDEESSFGDQEGFTGELVTVSDETSTVDSVDKSDMSYQKEEPQDDAAISKWLKGVTSFFGFSKVNNLKGETLEISDDDTFGGNSEGPSKEAFELGGMRGIDKAPLDNDSLLGQVDARNGEPTEFALFSEDGPETDDRLDFGASRNDEAYTDVDTPISVVEEADVILEQYQQDEGLPEETPEKGVAKEEGDEKAIENEYDDGVLESATEQSSTTVAATDENKLQSVDAGMETTDHQTNGRNSKVESEGGAGSKLDSIAKQDAGRLWSTFRSIVVAWYNSGFALESVLLMGGILAYVRRR